MEKTMLIAILAVLIIQLCWSLFTYAQWKKYAEFMAKKK